MTLLTPSFKSLKQGHSIYRLNVDQYHEMIREGILREGEPYELLDGIIVRKDRSAKGEDPMTVGNHHTWVVQKLMGLNARLARFDCHLRAQQPILLRPFSEPEPDGAIVIGTDDDYLNRKPQAKDILCVIEVADATLKYDRRKKLPLYANGGVELYYIINLVDHVIEAYSEPQKGRGRYAQSMTLQPGQSLAIPTGGQKHLKVPVRQLLPA